MKKLLVLLFATLVIGLVFSGPIHINGPGINTGNANEFVFGGVFATADTVTIPVTDQVISNYIRAEAVLVSDLTGVVAGESQGFYNYTGFDSSPFILTAVLITHPDSLNEIFGDVSQSQEVMSRSGCTKPGYTRQYLII